VKKNKKRMNVAPAWVRAMRELETEEQRIDWLLTFANQLDVDKLSTDQLDEIYDGPLFIFSLRGGEGGVEEERPRSAAELFVLQEALRSGLRQSIKLDDSRVGGFAGWEIALDQVKRRVFRGHSCYFGPLRAAFLAAAADVIVEDREKRLMICPKCERFFLRKHRRARYCTSRCADAARQKRYRTAERA
jgi:hypothetical protein